MLWVLLCPMVFTLSQLLNATRCRKGLQITSPSLWSFDTEILSPVHWLHSYPTPIFHIIILFRRIRHWCCTLTVHYRKRDSQTWIPWSIKYSTTRIVFAAKPNWPCSFYICLCKHMQCSWLHVCMSMRPMVLSTICLIYGLDTLINH